MYVCSITVKEEVNPEDQLDNLSIFSKVGDFLQR